MKAVVVSSLTKVFDGFTAVNSISFDIDRGEVFGLLGANGAGKTTTIRMLCGVLEPTSGSAFIAGFDVVKEPEQVKRRIGYMSQKFSLYRELSVYENMEFYGGLYGLRGRELTRRIWEVGELLEVSDKMNDMVSDLPRGIQQRAAFACAILHDPEVIFLDEPTAGIDPLQRRRFWNIIYELSASGKTLIVTTHYLDEAEFCHRVAFMSSGNILVEGAPSRLKEELSNYEMYELLVEPISKGVSALKGVEWVEWVYAFGSFIHVLVRKGTFSTDSLETYLRARGIDLLSFEKIEPSLEDVFLFLEGGRRRRS